MINIKVPATSANLAVGYDCLGLAVDLFANFEFEDNNQRLTINGCPEAFQNEQNIVYQAFVKGCQFLNQTVPNVSITIDTPVPVSRGLGSSATCIVGGLAAAGEWFETPFSKTTLLELTTKMEGHPDNVAPAIYGGLCLATYDQDNQLQVVKYPVNPKWHLLAIVPDFKVSTKQARESLPKQMDYATATHQISHALLMMTAMQSGDLKLLRTGLTDKMQQPYRENLIDGFNKIKNIVEQSDGAYYVSGSGSTIMTIAESDQQRKQIQTLVNQQFPTWQTLPVKIDESGVQTEVGSNQ